MGTRPPHVNLVHQQSSGKPVHKPKYLKACRVKPKCEGQRAMRAFDNEDSEMNHPNSRYH
jgi:hypothetical protein